MTRKAKANLIAAAVALLLCPSVGAKTPPELSGKYVVNYSFICQATDSSFPGTIHNEIYSADFAPKSKTVTITSISLQGSLVIWAGVGGFSESTYSSTVNYSNTASKLQIGEPSYNVIYGAESNGIAQSFALNVESGPCAYWATAVR